MVLVDTRCKNTLETMLQGGKVVAGAGAGAMVLCDQMVLPQGEELLAGGTSLVGRLILATTSSPESMLRLLQAVGSFQGSLYLGAALAPGSGLLIQEGEARVVGDTSVTLMDARDCLAMGQDDDGEAAALGVICGLKVHHLAPGYGINLRSRRPLAPAERPTPAAGD
jgi:cyanophycinase-like exopeptidase